MVTSDTKFKLALCLLLIGLLLIFARNVLGAEKAVLIDIQPRVTATSPYKQVMFRVRITIPRHKDNKLWSYTASCGDEIKSSQRELNAGSAVTYTWFEELKVTEDCIFQVCIHRAEKGKVKNYCDYQGVSADVGDSF